MSPFKCGHIRNESPSSKKNVENKKKEIFFIEVGGLKMIYDRQEGSRFLLFEKFMFMGRRLVQNVKHT